MKFSMKQFRRLIKQNVSCLGKAINLKTCTKCTGNDRKLGKSGIFTLIILKNIYFIALLMKRALKWYIFHQILIILKISLNFHVKTSNSTALQ